MQIIGDRAFTLQIQLSCNIANIIGKKRLQFSMIGMAIVYSNPNNSNSILYMANYGGSLGLSES